MSILSGSEILFKSETNVYLDRKYYADLTSQLEVSTRSSTVYVGNLIFDPEPTPEDLIHAHFSMAGPVDEIIMGINRNTKMPCGFCFVVYEDITSAREAVTMLNGTRLWKVDGSGHGIIRVELDPGFKSGRQFGRGSSGAQVRSDRLNNSSQKRRRDPEPPRDGSDHYGPPMTEKKKEKEEKGGGEEGGEKKEEESGDTKMETANADADADGDGDGDANPAKRRRVDDGAE
ncbi:hypothetical protein TL16_g09035 [Triparma laevis f. inornata]|uniref:Nuclear cap-binding protein subunit 2 n=1 Tax=Triparma laevis f. inornata TaxID=1714386 RepID=A0A9W7B5A9_9STRA|nr:hypothetical protein TL16_g09035 [Triparma laevis f. inornata]